jgi:hypothetical protein
MMDPATIVALSVALAKGFKAVYNVFEGIRLADATIDALRKEVKALSHALEGIHQSFNDPSLAQALVSARGNHWESMNNAMRDCTEVLKSLNNLTESTSSNRGMVGRRWDQFMVALKSGEIALLQKQVTSHRSVMEMSMHMIMLYNTPF